MKLIIKGSAITAVLVTLIVFVLLRPSKSSEVSLYQEIIVLDNETGEPINNFDISIERHCKTYPSNDSIFTFQRHKVNWESTDNGEVKTLQEIIIVFAENYEDCDVKLPPVSEVWYYGELKLEPITVRLIRKK